MKKWVRKFLAEENEKYLQKNKQLSEEIIAQLRKENMKNLQSDEFVYITIVDFIDVNFGFGGFNCDTQMFSKIFSSVIVDLPKEVFDYLRTMKSLFFTFIPNPGAEVIRLGLKHDMQAGDTLTIVHFPYFLLPMGDHMFARGMIVHEIAHVYAHSDLCASNDIIEDEANEIARKWGFTKDIEAMIKTLKLMGDTGQ